MIAMQKFLVLWSLVFYAIFFSDCGLSSSPGNFNGTCPNLCQPKDVNLTAVKVSFLFS